MVESGQEIPDFLESYRPIGEINFEEPDSDAEEIAEDPTGGIGAGEWGGAAAGAGADAGDGWGGPADTATPAADTGAAWNAGAPDIGGLTIQANGGGGDDDGW